MNKNMSKKYKNGRSSSKNITNSSNPINLKIRTSNKNMFNISDYLMSSRSGVKTTKATPNMNDSFQNIDSPMKHSGSPISSQNRPYL